MKHREVELLERYFTQPQINEPTLLGWALASPRRMAARIAEQKNQLDLLCNAIELGMPVEKWQVAGRLGILLKELRKRGIYQPHHEVMLNELVNYVPEAI